MKKLFTLFVLLGSMLHIFAQPLNDTTVTLVAQKENIITEETILKVENLGADINTSLPELRPTISADGNLLFFICQNHPYNTKYGAVPNSQDIWFQKETVWENGAKQSILVHH